MEGVGEGEGRPRRIVYFYRECKWNGVGGKGGSFFFFSFFYKKKPCIKVEKWDTTKNFSHFVSMVSFPQPRTRGLLIRN